MYKYTIDLAFILGSWTSNAISSITEITHTYTEPHNMTKDLYYISQFTRTKCLSTFKQKCT